MEPSDHLSVHRLTTEALTGAEQAHLAACVRCRADRRMAVRGAELTEPAAPSPPYVVGRWVGSGAMGAVYEARHASLGTRHAVKLLHHPDPALRARLLREGRLQARVAHRNLVPVEDFVELDGALALVMPFVDGPTLARVLGDRPLPVNLALALFHAVVRGVEAMHRAGLVHRDLKPSNVLLQVLPDDVVPRVTDFGLAKALVPTDPSLFRTGSGALLGTPSYAAPEQLTDAAHVGPAADVFSLGCLLYELVSGVRAYSGFERAPPDLDRVPLGLRALIARCLATDPSARPEDASALLAALPEPGPTAGLVAWCRPEAPRLADTLPREPDAFVGREAALGRVDEILVGSRCVTLTGPGGVGKTRLMLRYAHGRGSRFAAGAVWVDPRGEPTHAAVARALGLPAGESVGRALANRGQVLVLLDDPVDLDPVAGWLERVPGLAVLAARRVGLGGDEVPVDALSPTEATALLVARAPHLLRTGSLEATVDLLDRIPLAIELFAPSRPPLAAPTPDRAAPLRVLDAVWAELSSAPQRVLAQLSVFGAPFSIDAAEAVVEPDGSWVADHLQELCDRALLRSVGGAPEIRLTLPSVVREYAAGRLSADHRLSAELRRDRWLAVARQDSVERTNDRP